MCVCDHRSNIHQLTLPQVIQNTFTPLISKGQSLPQDLVPKLLHRFASREGYEAPSNLVPTLRSLKQGNSRRSFDQVIIGVITNSDDRVPSVLSSFGLNVSPMRYGIETEPAAIAGQTHDIDFHCMSYDVGVEKPDKLIFNSAELMLAQILAMRDAESPSGASGDVGTWWKVHVGDEYAKDVVGSKNAGWNPVLLDETGQSSDITSLEDCPEQAVDELFKHHDVVRVSSIQNLVSWLTGQR